MVNDQTLETSSVCCVSRSLQTPNFTVILSTTTYLIPMHIMIREIIPGSQQRIRRCLLSNVTVAGILIKSAKVPAALPLAEVIDLAETVD